MNNQPVPGAQVTSSGKLRASLSPLRLPHRLLLQTRDCDGISNAWSNEESVTVCYEYVNDIRKNAPEHETPTGIAPIDTIIGPLLDVFLHEAAHAVFASRKFRCSAGKKMPPTSFQPT